MEFTNEQIETVLRSNFKFKKIWTINRIIGGYSKYTYEVNLDERIFIFQIWAKPDYDNNEIIEINENGYLYPGGISNYIHVNKMLSDLKIRTPVIYFIDDTKSKIPFDCSLSQYIEIDSYRGIDEHKKNGTDKQLLEELGRSFGKLKQYTREHAGVFINTTPFNPVEVVLFFAIEHINRGLHVNYLQNNRDTIFETLYSLKENIKARSIYHLIHSDFKPDNFRFDKKGGIYWIDFESIQFFDIEYEMSQFVIPEFMVTNCDSFYKRYNDYFQMEVDRDRLVFYKIIRCITQIYNCSISLKNIASGKEPIQAIINNNISTLNNMLYYKK